jgi:hypothetical protein
VHAKNLLGLLPLLLQSPVFAETGIETYTFEDYVIYALGLAFIAIGAAIILSMMKERE